MVKNLSNILGGLGNIVKKKTSEHEDDDLNKHDTLGGIAEGLNIYANQHVGLEQFQR